MVFEVNPGSVRRRGRVLAGALVALVLLGAMASASPATPGVWQATGPATNSVTGAGTVASPMVFTYDYDLGSPAGGVPQQRWDVQTEAAATGPVTLGWHWVGDHSTFQVTARLEGFVIPHGGGTGERVTLVNAGPANCCTTPSNGFDYSGTVTLHPAAGDTYGFTLYGSNFDSRSFLCGALVATQGTVPAAPARCRQALPPAPTLIGAVPNGSSTIVVGRVPGGGSSATLEFVSAATCTDGVLGGTPTTIGTVPVTLDANGYFALKPGDLPNVPVLSYVAARVTTPSAGALSTCVVAKAGNDAWPKALPLDATGLTTQDVLDSAGQSRWYTFAVSPGAQVTVSLTNLPDDYSLVLFKDINQAFNTLTSTQDLTKLSAQYAPSAFSPSAFSPSAFSPSAFSPSAFSPSAFSPSAFSADVFSPSAFSPSAFSPSAFSPSAFSPSAFSPSAFSPSAFSPSAFSPSAFSPSAFSPSAFSSAQTQSVVAVDADPGTADKVVVANTGNNTGNYYIRVTGRNGAFDTNGKYTVNVTKSATSCSSVVPMGTAPQPAAAGNFKTVILTDPTRIAGSAADKAALATKLATFAARPEVAGAIVDLSKIQRVTDLNAQADANAPCPYAKNLLASAIKDVVDSYRANNPGLHYVVLVGGDGVIPFFRYHDESLLGPESGYFPPVKSTSASDASLRLDQVLGQDAYGSTTAVSVNSASVPVPGLAVGRLVETASEASGMLDAYTAAGGVVTPHSTLVTGYDFLADAANSVEQDLAAGTAGTGQIADTLIAPNNISPQDPQAWTATQLKAKLLGATKHDLVFLAGHFSANSALAADFSTNVLTTDLAAASTDFRNTIVFSAGCHSGYNIVDGDAIAGITLPLDWAQAFAQKQATLIAGTGYQYGDTDFIEYSEQIYADLATQFRYGSGAVSIGDALVRSKQDYLATTPDLHGIPQKAVLEATIFGLPMLSVNMPAGRLPAPVSGSVVGSTTGYATNPGSTLGLRTASVMVTPTLTRHSVTLKNLSGGSVDGTYYSGGAGVQADPAQPALPLELLDVTPPDRSLVLRGVGFRGGAYGDQSVVPLTGAPTTELRGVHVPFASPVFFPMRLATPNYFDALHGGRTNLLVTPAQHMALDLAAGTSTLRLYTSLTFQLFYSGYLGDAALSAAPDISGVEATGDGAGGVTFSAHVVGNPAAGIQQVWVTSTPASGGTQWTSLDLTQSAVDSTLWTGTLAGVPPAGLRFVVQAVNGLGLVTLDDNLGAYYQVAGAAAPPAAKTTLQLQSPPTSGAFGESKTVTAVLRAGGAPVSGKTVVLSIGGSDRAATTGADGSATATVPLTGLPGPTLVSASFAGDSGYDASGASAPFTIAQAQTLLSQFTTQPAVVLSGGSSGVTTTLTSTINGSPQPLLQQTVTFTLTGPKAKTYSTITDYLGRATLPTDGLLAGAYAVTATFAGDATYAGASQTGQLVISPFTGFIGLQNPPALNKLNSGSTQPIKFSLGGDRGLAILAPGSPSSVPVNCQTGAVTGAGEAAASTAGLTFVSGFYQFDWKTAKSYTGCRRFDLALVDGTMKSLLFDFR
jgi:hypothetical protein